MSESWNSSRGRLRRSNNGQGDYFFVGQEREVELLRLLEEGMREDRVAADADHDDALFVEGIHVVAELLSLGATTGGEIGREKVDDHILLADEVARPPELALIVGRR